MTLSPVGIQPFPDRVHSHQQHERDGGQHQAGGVGPLGMKALDPVVDVKVAVWVLPIRLPETTRTAPNSPSERATVSVTP